MRFSARRFELRGGPESCCNGSRDRDVITPRKPTCGLQIGAPTLAIASPWAHCSGNVALPWHDLSSSSEKYVVASLPRHHFSLKRGCAALVIIPAAPAKRWWSRGSPRVLDLQADVAPSTVAAIEARKRAPCCPLECPSQHARALMGWRIMCALVS